MLSVLQFSLIFEYDIFSNAPYLRTVFSPLIFFILNSPTDILFLESKRVDSNVYYF